MIGGGGGGCDVPTELGAVNDDGDISCDVACHAAVGRQ